ncbi:glutaredoxin-like [Asparagus officinalis]|uniref:glutaredoxin-like n=1 Tax=Asparagus officinalis TaxID=4686 RepID=UPI00098E2142|nr:glutaredoxin-like [Asparagus officinalis]
MGENYAVGLNHIRDINVGVREASIVDKGHDLEFGGRNVKKSMGIVAKSIEPRSKTLIFLFIAASYCLFSGQVKQLLSQLNASYKMMELDRESDGYEVQSALVEWTGQRTVPNVFIGGCDSVIAKHRQGKLVALLTEAGALAT